MESDQKRENVAGVCLTPKCGKAATRRGLCTSCRMQARRAVKSGSITEATLIRRGLMLPRKTRVFRGLLSLQIHGRKNQTIRKAKGEMHGKAKKKAVKKAKRSDGGES